MVNVRGRMVPPLGDHVAPDEAVGGWATSAAIPARLRATRASSPSRGVGWYARLPGFISHALTRPDLDPGAKAPGQP